MGSFSTNAGLARPVRTLANSTWACSTALFIFSPVSASTMSVSSLIGIPPGPASPNQGTHAFPAGEDPPDVARLEEVEHDDRQRAVHAERDRRGVHHPQPPVEDVHVGDVLELGRVGVDARI